MNKLFKLVLRLKTKIELYNFLKMVVKTQLNFSLSSVFIWLQVKILIEHLDKKSTFGPLFWIFNYI
jgi:hypothetical protein